MIADPIKITESVRELEKLKADFSHRVDMVNRSLMKPVAELVVSSLVKDWIEENGSDLVIGEPLRISLALSTFGLSNDSNYAIVTGFSPGDKFFIDTHVVEIRVIRFKNLADQVSINALDIVLHPGPDSVSENYPELEWGSMFSCDGGLMPFDLGEIEGAGRTLLNHGK